MNVTVLICTYGSEEWELMGRRAALSVPDTLGVRCRIVLRHEPEGTLASCRNNAASSVKVSAGGETDWLCFLDADDALDPGYFRAMQETAAFWNLHRRSDMVYNPLLLVPALKLGDQPPAIPAWERQLIDENCACIGTLIPHTLFNRIGGFRRELPSLEDWDLWLRAVKAGARLVAVPDAVYVARTARTVRDGRNANQKPYRDIRAEHLEGFEWDELIGYKLGARPGAVTTDA